MKIIDLSQEIYPGMPVFNGHPEISMELAVTHEMRAGIENPKTISPIVHALHISEHTSTHVDAYNHFLPELREESIDTMPLEMFLTSGFAVDVSYKKPLELISVDELKNAVQKAGQEIRKGDTILIYSDHFRKCFGTPQWDEGPGLSLEAVEWLSTFDIAGFAVETRSPGVLGKGNKEIHTLCGNKHFTHYENLVNLYKLIGEGRFLFIGLPLKIRGGTGSPVRAVALFE